MKHIEEAESMVSSKIINKPKYPAAVSNFFLMEKCHAKMVETMQSTVQTV